MDTMKKEFNENELKNSNRIFKSATPKYTADWYLKWVASAFVLAAMSIRGVDGLSESIRFGVKWNIIKKNLNTKNYIQVKSGKAIFKVSISIVWTRKILNCLDLEIHF